MPPSTLVRIAISEHSRLTGVDAWACSPLRSWFLVNRVVDVIFVVDMVLQFFIMYRAPEYGTEWASAGEIGERFGEDDMPGGSSSFRESAVNTGQSCDGTTVLSSTGVLYVADPGKIRRRYIFSAWFVLDVLSIAPSVHAQTAP